LRRQELIAYLLQDIEERYILYVQQNNKAIQQARFYEVKNAQEQCVCFYVEKMNVYKIEQHQLVVDLTEKHAYYKNKALAELDVFLAEDESHVLQNAEVVRKYCLLYLHNF
jgi:hypothetical protein